MNFIGVCMSSLEWKDENIFSKMLKEGNRNNFFRKLNNKLTCYIATSDHNDTDDFYLATDCGDISYARDFIVDVLKDYVYDDIEDIEYSVDFIDPEYLGIEI